MAIEFGVGFTPGTAFDVLAVGREHNHVEAGHVDGVAGMNGAARRSADGLDVSRIVVAGDVGVLAVDAMIEELADLDMFNEVRHTTDMIDMEVGDEDLVDH